MTSKHPFSSDITQALKPLFRLNNWRGIVALMEDGLAAAFAVYLSILSPYFYPLSLLIIGSRQRALTSLLHESCHLTLARNRWLNLMLGRIAGAAIFHSHDAYRKSHVSNHHAFLGDASRDPDYINYISTGLTAVTSKRQFVRGFVLKTVLLGNVPNYLRYVFINRIAAIIAKPREMIELLLVQGAIFVALQQAAGAFGYLLFWLVPYFTTFQIIGWLSEISEHYRLYEQKHSALKMTRNRFPAWWEALFVGMHGDNYHLTHHLFAGIPYWNLKRAHAVLMADPAYRALNEFRGGIVSAPPPRKSVLSEIIEDIEKHADVQVEPVSSVPCSALPPDALSPGAARQWDDKPPLQEMNRQKEAELLD